MTPPATLATDYQQTTTADALRHYLQRRERIVLSLERERGFSPFAGVEIVVCRSLRISSLGHYCVYYVRRAVIPVS